MPSKPLKLWALLLLLVPFASFAHGQVAPAAREGVAPIEFGGGGSLWFANYGKFPDYMVALTAWGDIHPKMPDALRGLGAEIEFREANWGRVNVPSYVSQQTIGGGPIYNFGKFHLVRPYAKFLIAHGTEHFNSGNPKYTSDTRLVYAPGGGAEFELPRGFGIRADYEYQIWDPLLSPTARPTPNGLTISASYNLGRVHRQ